VGLGVGFIFHPRVHLKPVRNLKNERNPKKKLKTQKKPKNPLEETHLQNPTNARNSNCHFNRFNPLSSLLLAMELTPVSGACAKVKLHL
jgi:hypothetical protein